jgi:hypothetical protein
MELTVNRLDLTKMTTPTVADRISRRPGDTWLIPYSTIDFSRPIDWRKSLRGDDVEVPLVPYLTASELDIAMGFMVQIGAHAAASIAGDIQRLHLAIGCPVAEVVDEADGSVMWRYLLGFAVLLANR